MQTNPDQIYENRSTSSCSAAYRDTFPIFYGRRGKLIIAAFYTRSHASQAKKAIWTIRLILPFAIDFLLGNTVSRVPVYQADIKEMKNDLMSVSFDTGQLFQRLELAPFFISYLVRAAVVLLHNVSRSIINTTIFLGLHARNEATSVRTSP